MPEEIAQGPRTRRRRIALGLVAGIASLFALLGIWGVLLALAFAALIGAGYAIDAAVSRCAKWSDRIPVGRPMRTRTAALQARREDRLVRARRKTAARLRRRSTTPFARRLSRFSKHSIDEAKESNPLPRSRMGLTLTRPIGTPVPPKPCGWIRRMLNHIQWLVRDWPAQEPRLRLRRITAVARRRKR